MGKKEHQVTEEHELQEITETVYTAEQSTKETTFGNGRKSMKWLNTAF